MKIYIKDVLKVDQKVLSIFRSYVFLFFQTLAKEIKVNLIQDFNIDTITSLFINISQI